MICPVGFPGMGFNLLIYRHLMLRVNDNSLLTSIWVLFIFFLLLIPCIYLFMMLRSYLLDVIGVLVSVGEVERLRAKGIA